jgi:transcriptional regulator GlxA family with amidase domain
MPVTRSRTRSPRRTRTVVLFAYDGCQSLDVTGPLEVFNLTNLGSGVTHYQIVLASPRGGEIRCNSGLRIAGTVALSDLRSVDTFLIVGGNEAGLRGVANDTAALELLRKLAQRARRFGSVCTGAFLLGAAGLIEGRRVTTHWDSCALLAEMFPTARVVPDAIYVADGALYTSAGITAAMDLALALVEADLGARLALSVARHLVVFLRRSGGQSQFSATLAAQASASHRLRELLNWIVENPTADLTLPALATRANMSERSLTRHFRKTTGGSPGVFVEAARLDRARLLLEETDWQITKLAHACGFGSVDAFQRTFMRRLDTTPREYRRRFAGAQREV